MFPGLKIFTQLPLTKYLLPQEIKCSHAFYKLEKIMRLQKPQLHVWGNSKLVNWGT